MTPIRSFLFLALAAAATGCAGVVEPFVHADAQGYEAGVRGTWKAAAQSAENVFNKSDSVARRNDGKAVQ